MVCGVRTVTFFVGNLCPHRFFGRKGIAGSKQDHGQQNEQCSNEY